MNRRDFTRLCGLGVTGLALEPWRFSRAVELPAASSATSLPSKVLTMDLGGSTWTLQQAGQTEKLPALVPGEHYSDLLRTGKIPDPYYRDNNTAVQLAAKTGWTYQRTFEATPEQLAMKHVELVCHGLDTLATVTLNGTVLSLANNMFRTWVFDVQKALRPGTNDLQIQFQPLPDMIQRYCNLLRWIGPIFCRSIRFWRPLFLNPSTKAANGLPLRWGNSQHGPRSEALLLSHSLSTQPRLCRKLIRATALLLSLTTCPSTLPAEDRSARPISEWCAELPFNSFPPNQLLRRENPDGSAVSLVHAAKTGTSGEFFIQVDRPGTYRVDVNLLKGADKGISQLLVNGDPVGEPIDSYSSGGESAVKVSVGEVTFLKPANHSFRFLVTGKNSSSTGSDLALQSITLTPVAGFTLLSPNGSCQNDKNVLLRWNSWPQARRYRVEVDGSVASTVDALTTNWQATRLAAGSHRWRVVAVGTNGKEQPSNIFSFVVGTPSPYPYREFSDDFSSLHPDDWMLQSMTAAKNSGMPCLEASGPGFAMQKTVRLDKTEGELSVKITPDGANSAAGVGFQADDGTQLYAVVDFNRSQLRIERKLVGTERYSIFDVTPKAYQVKGWNERAEGDAIVWEIAAIPITLKAGTSYELKLAYSRRSGCVMATLLPSDGSLAVTLRDLTDLCTPDRPVLLSLSGKAMFEDVSLRLLNKLVYKWDPDSTRIVLRPGEAGAWDAKGAFNPAIIVRNGQWYMVYRGNAKAAPPNGPPQSELGVATSSDGVHWTKYPRNPIIALSPARSTVEDPDLLFSEATTTYYLEYVLLHPKGYQPKIPGREMMATSTDGIHYSEPWRLLVAGKIGGIIDTHNAPTIPDFNFGGEKYRYLAFIEEGGVYLSNDLHQWEKMGEADIKGRPDIWCNFHECAGDIFVDADHNLRIEAQAGTDKRISGNRLCTNVEDVLSSSDPTKVIARGDLPWLPDWYGDAPTGAPEDFTATNGSVFPGQTIIKDGWLWHYSGGNNHCTLLTKCQYGPVLECRNLKAVADASGQCAVSVVVRNIGSLAGSGNVTLSLDGKSMAQERPTTLDRDTEKTLDWKVSVPTGIHTLSVANLSITLRR